jgi:hypothetical protein
MPVYEALQNRVSREAGILQNGQTFGLYSWSLIDLLFAPLVKGGLPAFFSQTTDGSGNAHIYVQLNTSK